MLRRDLIQQGYDPALASRKKIAMQRSLIVETIWVACLTGLLIWCLFEKSSTIKMDWKHKLAVLQISLSDFIFYCTSWQILQGYEKRYLQQTF